MCCREPGEVIGGELCVAGLIVSGRLEIDAGHHRDSSKDGRLGRRRTQALRPSHLKKGSSMLVIALNPGAETTFTNLETGEVIKLILARGGDSPRIGITADRKWNILRSDATVKHSKPHQIQESNERLCDIARRPA